MWNRNLKNIFSLLARSFFISSLTLSSFEKGVGNMSHVTEAMLVILVILVISGTLVMLVISVISAISAMFVLLIMLVKMVG